MTRASSVGMRCVAALLLIVIAGFPGVLAEKEKVKPFYAGGAHRMVEITYVGTREEIVEEGDLHRQLLDLGILDEEIADGSAALGMIYCCGGKISLQTRFLFYVPPESRVQVGDFVEIRLRENYGIATAVQVRQEAGATHRTCRWYPEQEGLWMRVVYCDWMTMEGWVYNKKLRKTWYKPASLEGS